MLKFNILSCESMSIKSMCVSEFVVEREREKEREKERKRERERERERESVISSD